MPNPFEGRWSVTFFELRDRDGAKVGLPFGADATFAIVTDGELLQVTLEPPRSGDEANRTPPVFQGRWSQGEDATMSARWVDETNGFLYQLVALGQPHRLTGGYFRVPLRSHPMPQADSEGTGSWTGTGPILPYDPERG
jgi:hypothetical protein